MNTTIRVAVLYECDSLYSYIEKLSNTFDPLWRSTVTGCIILDILRDMYKFNITYIYDNQETNVTVLGGAENESYVPNDNIDVYARSMTLNLNRMDYLYPVLAVNTWKFGFLLRRPEEQFFSTFYSKPFSRPVWNCLYILAFFVSIIFYLLKRWEVSVLGGWDCSYTYESLMVVGAYCQHIPPIDARLASRRIAYLIFLGFSYTIYTFYTSNLLSNIVNDKDQSISLEILANSNYECVLVDYIQLAASRLGQRYNFSILMNKLVEMQSISVPDGVDAMRKGYVALLSDYTTIYPYIIRTLNNEEICKLISIDLYSRIKNFLFTTKHFQYKEQFKIGTLRIKEVGVLKRIVATDFGLPTCTQSHLVQTSLIQISIPITVLVCSYVVCVLILLAERLHYQRNKVYPYVN